MRLEKSELKDNETIEISGSKSISNRLLILSHLFENIIIENLSNSQDTQLLQKALESDSETIDIHHAGTAMRFLTSYLSIQEGRTTILTGSDRMTQRPIQFLVDALRDLGADISYVEKEGFPPLKIVGKKIVKSKVMIPADISSQFISSLMLIGAELENGLQINLIGKITSRPYLEMTLRILRRIGVSTQWEGQVIKIFPNIQTDKSSQITKCIAESDWSSASYFYSLAAIGRKSINLKSFRPHSLQGDSAIKEIYWNFFGVNTISQGSESKISLMPESTFVFPEEISLDMNDCPDIAQTLCVTATALQIPFKITGLSTLKVKETDRLVALKNELFKIGCITEITENSIHSTKFFEPNEDPSIATYDDHRMAMSFAPFCLIKPLTIENKNVVEKSYPQFWEDFQTVTEPIL
ncbi:MULTISPECIES: 3-phosphoshikimate 1-carboxyvinyltransferase [unclassified Kaistella]|uniref:3-phosphoshikimate 1-carboxyvinyltransferase n=1 Tax=unclassified Kaistella TaxID=2762626 RepID=UPI0027325B7B|nr:MULTISPECIES: 3-phosphoshikimate 1-carboxyvinyltransferase [unclassified Kaistella]MDP2454383.1 3-phosphoshikimate 1-carboxyvinyltransferase [Kaistella sp. SH11-4b]MDP2457870.1 3-phosphoshikimate 1-carboxyvinyltransferase [Kaistella sp. SH40-3]MDP2460776.1 3-phosphoshikimate 1-carboxyvinyltransferase [Kaistella sp. SH19-2b]